MNDVVELKRYVEVHARGQRIQGYRDILARIGSDEGDGPGTWVAEWSQAGEDLARAGRPLEASRHFAMARFPYVDGPGRHRALERCAQTLEEWQRERAPELERLDIVLPGGRVRCWSTGLSTTRRLPLVLIMGGIVTVKEQWVPALVRLRRLGLAAVVTEMPGVGENTLPYDAKSWHMLSGILDTVADRALVERTYAMALSFSGHMALRCALDDARLRGVVTVGAPVHDFFTDTRWQARVPRITMDTLARLTDGTPRHALGDMADSPSATSSSQPWRYPCTTRPASVTRSSRAAKHAGCATTCARSPCWSTTMCTAPHCTRRRPNCGASGPCCAWNSPTAHAPPSWT
ncbi:alpha/beta hydrolase [Streptomyces lavenduligriseus]|uniref:Alpha/beta hydrolase n=1 Tax=Streptomyces lavenduligriseus TaxID=67315 RepID=A0ABT0P4Z1_9ACTN|nr:alpha/beta hydrolase [Streptomyces lavenduligriseus]MCL3998807.1 alpha/beta hydrolase [Streptomyces lavenduligriseus]